MALLTAGAVSATDDYDYQRAKGLYDQKDYAASLPMFKELSDRGYCDAHGYVGLQYELGEGTAADAAMADKYYRRAYDCGQPWWSYRWGAMLYKAGRYKDAWGPLKLAYDKGPKMYSIGEIAYYLGAMLQAGAAGTGGRDKVIEYYRKAAKCLDGFCDDYRKKATACLEEMGVPVYEISDFKEPDASVTMGMTAKSLYQKGYNYYSGFGTEKKDYTQAYTYLRAAAKMGHPKAWEYLGYMFNMKELPIYDPARSNKAFAEAARLAEQRLAADSGDTESAYLLGKLYMDGKGVEENLEKAADAFELGAKAGDDGCQLWLGMTLDKLGRYNDALYWLEECGRNGQGWGAYLAGKMYEKGRDGTGVDKIEPDRELAIEMYRASAKTNNYYASDARSALSRLGVSKEGVVRPYNTRRLSGTTSAKEKPAAAADYVVAPSASSLGIRIAADSVADLGLRSGTLWACFNLGASKPSDNGDYYSWGQTVPKTQFDQTSYYNRISSPTDIAGGPLDAATQTLGGGWRMPTHAQAMELLNDCEWRWCSVDGVNGMAVTGPNGVSIFLPAAGSYFSSSSPDAPYNIHESCYYWTSETADPIANQTALCLIMSKDYPKFDNRCGAFSDGKPIRPVFVSGRAAGDKELYLKKGKR